mmetsp:Transcript_26278/g.65723  ORF Transcript_26278/g.65723 Transcript_26278/m.65723 type:complete len:179 (+) Transcript_26278:153-689(+)
MTTIDAWDDELDQQILECSNWIVGYYVIKSDEGSYLDTTMEARQITRALQGLIGDGNLYPLFQPAIKLIESVFCLNEFAKRKRKAGSPEKTLQLTGKNDVTPENLTYYLKKLPKILDKKTGPAEKAAFLTYIMFVGRNVGEAVTKKGCNSKTSPAQLGALNEVARVFGVPPIPHDLIK